MQMPAKQYTQFTLDSSAMFSINVCLATYDAHMIYANFSCSKQKLLLFIIIMNLVK